MNGQAAESLSEHLSRTAITYVGLWFAHNNQAPALECVAADGAPRANRQLTAIGHGIADRYAKVFSAAGAGSSEGSSHVQSVKFR